LNVVSDTNFSSPSADTASAIALLDPCWAPKVIRILQQGYGTHYEF
jgi:hypothetical protein